MLDKKIFAKGMAVLSAVYPERECNQQTLDAYYELLKQFDARDFEKVIKNHVNQSKYFPKVCELKEELVRLKGFHRPTASDTWDNLLRAAETGEKPPMDENTERALAVCGGWEKFQFTPFKSLDFLRRDFIKAFNEGLEQDDRQLKIGQQGPIQKQLEGSK